MAQIGNSTETLLLFNDKRDEILKSLYYLFAACGFNPIQANPAMASSFGPENPFYRFKYITYIPKFNRLNNEGLVLLEFFAPADSITITLSNIHNFLVPYFGMSIGSGYSFELKVDDVIKVDDNCTHVIVYVQMCLGNGIFNRVPSFLTVSAIQSSNNLKNDALTLVMPMADVERSCEEVYRKNPPRNVQGHEWEQAFLNNPDPENYVPKLICGFNELGYHYRLTKTRSKKVYGRLQVLASKLDSLKVSINLASTKLLGVERQMRELSTKVLRVTACKIMVDTQNNPLSDKEIMLKSLIEPSVHKIDMLAKLNNDVRDVLRYNLNQPPRAQRIEQTNSLPKDVEECLLRFLQNQQDKINALMRDVKIDGETFHELEKLDDIKYPWES